MRPEHRPDEPAVADPANRTRLAWSRTALAFAAIGAAMLKNSPVAGTAILAVTIVIWAAARRTGQRKDALSSPATLRVVTATVVLVALTALVVVLTGSSPDGLLRLLHGN